MKNLEIPVLVDKPKKKAPERKTTETGATVFQLQKVLERAATLDMPEKRLLLAVIQQAVLDSVLVIRDNGKELSAFWLRRLAVREDARRFFFKGGYHDYAELCGLEPAYIKDLLIRHTTWAKEEYFLN